MDELEPADLAPDLPEAPAERVSWPGESGEDLSVGPGNEMPASQSGRPWPAQGLVGPVPGVVVARGAEAGATGGAAREPRPPPPSRARRSS